MAKDFLVSVDVLAWTSSYKDEVQVLTTEKKKKLFDCPQSGSLNSKRLLGRNKKRKQSQAATSGFWTSFPDVLITREKSSIGAAPPELAQVALRERETPGSNQRISCYKPVLFKKWELLDELAIYLGNMSEMTKIPVHNSQEKSKYGQRRR